MLLNIGADGLQLSKPQNKKTIVMGQQSWLKMKMMTLSNQLAAEEKFLNCSTWSSKINEGEELAHQTVL